MTPLAATIIISGAILLILAGAAIAILLIGLIKAAKKGDRILDSGLEKGTTHENGIGPGPEGRDGG